MSQRDIEIILARNLAEHLALSIFIVDPEGNLLFYNEPAEFVLGVSFDDTGPMAASEWATLFQPFDQHGRRLEPEELPLIIALNLRQPAHKLFWIKGLDGNLRQIAVTAFPLISQANRFLGAVAMFWEVQT